MIQLPKIIKSRGKRVGRGYGSGKGGHTVGRGQKGQKTRNKMGVLFEGIKMKKSLLKKLPFLRGKEKNKGRAKPLIIPLEKLTSLPANSTVDLDLAVKEGWVEKEKALKFGVKILGDDKIEKKLTIALPISKSAASIIEKAGGKVIINA